MEKAKMNVWTDRALRGCTDRILVDYLEAPKPNSNRATYYLTTGVLHIDYRYTDDRAGVNESESQRRMIESLGSLFKAKGTVIAIVDTEAKKRDNSKTTVVTEYYCRLDKCPPEKLIKKAISVIRSSIVVEADLPRFVTEEIA